MDLLPLYLLLGSAYALAFLAMASRWPWIALMLVFASAPFQQDLSIGGPARFSIAEVNLGLSLVVVCIQLFTKGRTLSIGPIAIPVVIYLAICTIASIWNWSGEVTGVALAQMIEYLVIAVVVFATLARTEWDYMPALYGLLAVAIFLTLVLIFFRSNFVLGLHKNGIGGSLACAVVVAIELWLSTPDRKRRRLLLATTAIITLGLVLSLSRGAWLGAMGATIVLLALRRRFMLIVRAIAIMIPIVALSWAVLPQEAQDYATNVGQESESTKSRLQTIAEAQDYFWKSPLLGNGIALRKQMDATNLVWICLAESGILGLAAFVAIHVVFFRMVWNTHKWLPQNDPMYPLFAIGAAVLVVKLIHGMLDHYWSRGELMMAWDGVGMATAVYLAAKKERFEAKFVRRKPEMQLPGKLSADPLLARP